MKSALTIIYALILPFTGDLLAASPAAPADVFDLHEWKLQIPGPLEIKELRNYSSGYFFLNENKEMCFSLDAAEKGATENTKYVRSELRHLPEWTVDGSHSVSGEIKVVTHLVPNKVTMLQIHGITDQGENAPPLLRIAMKDGDLYAMLKTENSGDENESVLLKRGMKTGFEKIMVSVQKGRLTVFVNSVEKLNRDVSYWKFSNYFKAGCYPQATQGTVQVFFRKLTVR